MPDFEYTQTVATIQVPIEMPTPQPGTTGKSTSVEFRAVGRIPLKQGWKAAFGSAEPEASTGKETAGDGDAEQMLPWLANGQDATLTRPRVQSKQTQPPPRYNEGTLVDAMQNAWRFVKDEALCDRLKEAKGIGTPATRAAIIKGLKRQCLLAADGKLVVPTPAGLQLFELLRGAAPALVDPGTTAIWEMRLDDVVIGKANVRSVIDEIAGEASRIIDVLSKHNGVRVDLSQPALVSRGRSKSKRKNNAPQQRTQRAERSNVSDAARPATARSSPPTDKMVAFAQRLAKDKNAKLPNGYDKDFDTCRRFLDQNLKR